MTAPLEGMQERTLGPGVAAVPPGPASLLGARANLLMFLSDPIRFMLRLKLRFGDLASLAWGRSDYIFALGPRHNRFILGNPDLFHNLDASNIPIRVPAGSALGRLFTGLIQMNGERHGQHRRLMSPAFSRGMLKEYLSGIAFETHQRLKGWGAGGRRDLAREMSELTLSIAIRVLLGIEPSEAGAKVRRLFWQWTDLVFSPWVLMLPADLPGFAYRHLLAVSRELEKEIRAVIGQRRAAAEAGRCALSVLIDAHVRDQAVLTEHDLIGQTNFLFMAGHATTANALTWTLFLLDQHPDILAAVREECASLDDANPSLEQLHALTLLDAVVKESLRLLPPVIWWCKVAVSPFEIEGYRFPAGTKVVQSAYVTHRDAALYPQADRFLPDRWARTNPEPYEYCPFSAGPRMCLGSTLAMAEIKLVVAIIVRRYRLALAAGGRVDARGPMILAPKGGIPVDILHANSARAPTEAHGTICSLVNLPGRGADSRMEARLQ